MRSPVHTGAPRRQSGAGQPGGRSVTVLVAVGLGPHPRVRSDHPERPEAVYGDLLPVLRRADLRIVNCECALTSATRRSGRAARYSRGTPAHVRGLTAVPFDVACLANNHVLDYGVARPARDAAGAAPARHPDRRRRAHRGAGVRAADAARQRAVDPHRQHQRRGGPDGLAGGPGVFGWDIPRAARADPAVQEAGGVVIAIAHCGLEYVPFPPPYVVAAFRAHVGRGRRLRHRPPSARAAGHRMARGPADRLQPRQLRVLPARPTCIHRKIGFLRHAALRRRPGRGLDLHPYRITDTGLRRLDPRGRAGLPARPGAALQPFRPPAGPRAPGRPIWRTTGCRGSRAEVLGILERMKTEPQKGAAMFRNRITTMQHSELWRTFLTRMASGERGGYSRADYRVVEEWFTKKARSCEKKQAAISVGVAASGPDTPATRGSRSAQLS